MSIELAKGVNLHIIPVNKYTTTKIVLNFATDQTASNSAVRNVLVNLLVNATAKYPDQTAIARHLARLYGADLDGYVTRVGTTHNLRISLNVVNDEIINQPVATTTVEFLRELLFHPLVHNGLLSPETWQRQRNNIVATLRSWNDDKQYLAAKRLLKLYFNADSIMQVPSVGTISALNQLNQQDLIDGYQSMLDHDQIDIAVVGNVDPDYYQKLFANWPFTDREPSLKYDLFYHQPLVSKVREHTDYEQIEQAKLDLAYQLPIYFFDSDYYAALVMNGMFGASPYSLLFQNVRERASLAYYASSSYRPFAGYSFVQSGINSENYDRTKKLIADQLAMLQDGQINVQQLDWVKKGLVNGYLTARDNPNQLIERTMIGALTSHQLPDHSIEKVEAVTAAQVSAAAQKMQMQAVYFLDRR